MNKQILTLGFEIPGYSDQHVDFISNNSFMDADLLLISPESIYPSENGWISFSSGGGCYDTSTSKNFINNLNHLRKEINDFLKSGKNIFLILSKKEDYSLADSVSHPRKGESLYNTAKHNNYEFLPASLGDLISASGRHITFLGNPIFSEFFNIFKSFLEYKLYIENPNEANVIFTGKDKTKVLGAIYKKECGHIIALPYISYDVDKYMKFNEKDDKNYWTNDALKFGEKLVNCLLAIDQQLSQNSEKTPTPKWAIKSEFTTKNVLKIQKLIQENEKRIEDINSVISELNLKLAEENIIIDLLFEHGKSLENAVTKALTILGYCAENYNDGVLELDQIIISPEKQRFIGECEGKDSKDINVTKFRQLVECLNADFAREEVQEKAFGILFGNPQRLENPPKRTLDFTQKCKIGAEREKIALVKTAELFFVVKYLQEHKDDKFKKACRDAIYNGLGKVVEFPEIPKI
jgi:hypothetical protein